MKKSIFLLIIFVCVIFIDGFAYNSPCYSDDDPLNDTGIDYSQYVPSENRRITIRGTEFHHSQGNNYVTQSEWTNLVSDLNEIFNDFGIEFESEGLSYYTNVDEYIDEYSGYLGCNNEFVEYLFSFPPRNVTNIFDIIFIYYSFESANLDYEYGIIDGEFDSQMIFRSNLNPSANVNQIAYYICSALGMYDVRADISGNGDYVDDTQSNEPDNLMNLSDLDDSLTDDQIGRLHWALTNHTSLKPLIRKSATLRNLVDDQDYGTVELDGSDPHNSPYTPNLLDRKTYTIKTTDRQVTYQSSLHQLAHWEDGSNDVRSLRFHQAETFDFDKKETDWYGRFHPTYSFSSSTSPSGLCDIEMEDPWADEGIFFKPAANYPVFIDYNDEFSTAMENYQIKAPKYCASTSHIYVFTGWTCGTAGDAVFEDESSNITKVDFQVDDAEVIANYTAVENQADYTATIPSGETLTIPAGADISFASGFTIDVVGAISALGTAASPISLTGTGKAASYDWFQFNPADTLIIVGSSQAELDLKHVNIEDVKCGVYFDGDDISAELNNVNFENTNVGIFIDRVVDNSIEIDSVTFSDNDIHVSFSDGLAEDDQTSTIIISNCVFSGDCDYSIWGFPQDDLSSYNSNIDLFICSNVFYDDNGIYLHIVGGGDYGDIDVESYNNIFHSSYCSLIAADDVDAGNNVGYNTSTSYMGNDVITDDPLLIDPDDGDFRIASNSPCVDAGGDYWDCMYLPEYDPDGTTPDIGAYYFPQTTFSGTIDSDTTWYGQVTVTGDVTVSNGVELTIDPGSMVMFNSGKEINVNGTITADGIANAHIVFTRSDTNSTSKSYWDRIVVNSTASYTFDNIEMYGASYGIRLYYNSGGTIQNSLFRQNYRALYLYNADNVTIRNCDIIDNSYGMYCSRANNLWIEDNLIDSSYYYGIYMYRSDGEIRGNVIRNSINYDGIRPYYLSGPDLSTSYDPDHIQINNTIANNNRYGVNAYSSSDTDLGTYLFIGTDYLGGFNYFNRGSSLYDVYNYNSGTVKAECNWWSSMSTSGSVDTSPTAGSLGFSLPKETDGKLPTAAEQLLAEAYYQEKVDSTYTKAITTLNRLAGIAPQDVVAYKVVLRLGRLYRKIGDVDGLKENLDALFTRYSDQLIGRIALDYSVSIYADEGNFREVLDRLAKVISLWRKEPAAADAIACALFEQGMIYMDMDSTSFLGKKSAVAAQNSFRELLEKYPDSEAAWLLENLMDIKSRDIDIGLRIPERFTFQAPYPNPFNPTTTFQFELPQATQLSLVIYNLNGEEVWRLNNRMRNDYPAGYHRVVWNGKNSQGLPVSTGAYIAVLTTPEYRQSHKVLLIK